MRTKADIGDSSVTGVNLEPRDTQDNHETLEVQQDYRILAMEVEMWGGLINTEVTSNTPSSSPETIGAEWQVATTGAFTDLPSPAAGGEVPAGVYFHHHHEVQQPMIWDDDTNGNAGALDGQGQDQRVVHFVPAEQLVNVDTTPDAGTSISIHVEPYVESVFSTTTTAQNAEGARHNLEVAFYVEEREDN